MPVSNQPLTATGNIRPCRAVKISGPFNVAEADANEACIGIAQEGTNVAPIPDVTSQYAAIEGQTLRVYQDGEECLMELADTIAAGVRLKSDADGKGVAAGTGSVQHIVATLLEDGVAGDKRRVRVTIVSATL